jgi:hypothetical protein
MSMRNERIVISDPPPSRTPETHRNAFNYYRWEELLQDWLGETITPQSHPRALELFAGDGPIAEYLYKQGWRNITCIDFEKSDTHFEASGVAWKYVDLEELLVSINMHEIPHEIDSLEHSFDIVSATFALRPGKTDLFDMFIPDRDIMDLCEFFAKPGALIFSGASSKIVRAS